MFGIIKCYIGLIEEVKGNQIKVDILGVKTDFMTYVGSFGGFNQHLLPPIVGEQVMVIKFEDSGLYLAFSIPPIIRDAKSNVESRTYSDGTTISYDTDTHELKINAKDTINIVCKNANIKSDDIKVECKKAIIKSNSIDLGDEGGGGVVTTQCICPFTGSPHPQGSNKIKAVL